MTTATKGKNKKIEIQKLWYLDTEEKEEWQKESNVGQGGKNISHSPIQLSEVSEKVPIQAVQEQLAWLRDGRI